MTSLNRAVVALAAALLPAIIFVSFPPAIIKANALEIAFDRKSLYAVWLLFGATSIVFASIAIARPKALVLLTSLAVNVVVWNGAYPFFWLNSSGTLAAAVAVEIAIFAVVLLALRGVPFALLTRASAIAALLTIAFAIPRHVGLFGTLRSEPEGVVAEPAARPATVSDKRFAGNVYHIVLDAFARPYLKHWVEKGGADLSGYTFYQNATANYGRTNLSMRSVFTGELHPNPITEWSNSFKDGFTKDLREAGVPMSFFPFYSFYCDPAATVCDATTDAYALHRKNIGTTFLLDIAFQSMMPVSLRDYMLGSLGQEQKPKDTWEYGFSITSILLGLFDKDEEFPKWRRPFQSFTMDTIDDFMVAEGKLPPTGRYVYLHVMIPHPPYVFDPDCTFVQPDKLRDKTFAQAEADQFGCAITMVKKITKRLSDLGRLQNSLVIFHADHGIDLFGDVQKEDPAYVAAQQIPTDRNTDDISIFPSYAIDWYANIAMLVHRPGQTSFEVSGEQAQLVDIAPTILDFFGLDHSDYSGVPLTAPRSSPPQREVVYFESNTGALEELKQVAKFVLLNGKWQFKGWRSVE